MEDYLRQLITIAFEDRKSLFSGFLIDYNEDWILLRNNPVDYILDGFVILKNINIESIIREEKEVFTERVIRLKGLKCNSEEIIPIQSLSSILNCLSSKFEIFQIAKKSDKTVYLGKLVEVNDTELIIDFLEPKGKFGGEMSFNPNKIRAIEFDTDYINSLKLIAKEENK